MEDLIKPEDMVVTLSHGGYMKTQPMDDYRAQKRGGRGKQAAGGRLRSAITQLARPNRDSLAELPPGRVIDRPPRAPPPSPENRASCARQIFAVIWPLRAELSKPSINSSALAYSPAIRRKLN